MYIFVTEDHMLDWHSRQICYPLENYYYYYLIWVFSKHPFKTYIHVRKHVAVGHRRRK